MNWPQSSQFTALWARTHILTVCLSFFPLPVFLSHLLILCKSEFFGIWLNRITSSHPGDRKLQHGRVSTPPTRVITGGRRCFNWFRLSLSLSLSFCVSAWWVEKWWVKSKCQIWKSNRLWTSLNKHPVILKLDPLMLLYAKEVFEQGVLFKGIRLWNRFQPAQVSW